MTADKSKTKYEPVAQWSAREIPAYLVPQGHPFNSGRVQILGLNFFTYLKPNFLYSESATWRLSDNWAEFDLADYVTHSSGYALASGLPSVRE